MTGRWIDSTVLRRSVTVPTLLLATAISTATLPLLVLGAACVDLATQRPWPVTRTALFLLFFLWAETIGVVLAAALYCRYALVMSKKRESFLLGNHRLQRAWARALFFAGSRLYGFDLRVEGAEQLSAPGPLLVLVRHASTVDTVIPVVLLSPQDWAFRYVIKKELMLDPCLDIVGHRLPNAFVERAAGKTDEEVQRIQALARDMGPRDALVVFPEGTRFTPAKRARLLERLEAAGDDAVLELARDLKATLSPLRRGSLALIEQTPNADVLVVAHTGLEAAGSLATLVRGGLVGATLKVRFWRFEASQISREPAAVRQFLASLWKRVDDFVSSSGESSPSKTSPSESPSP